MSVVTVEQVSKQYSGSDGPVHALLPVSMSVGSGEMVSVVGPNGAGKTTLLQIVAGVLAPSTGSVTRPRSTRALLEVGAAYDPDLTGRENLQLGLALDGIRSRASAAAVDEIAEFAGLAESLDLPVKHYSDGMVARLSAAQAVHHDVELLIMDEVMSVGDASFERQLMGRISELQAAGTAVLVATHSLALARSAARSLWLRDGVVVRDGPAASVLRDYELSAGFGRAFAARPRVRFVRCAAGTGGAQSGGTLEIAADLEVLEPSDDLSIRLEARPVVGEEQWMRPRDPAVAPADVLVAVTSPVPLGRLDPGPFRATGVIPEVRITPTLLEVSVVVVDGAGLLHDEISCPVAVKGRPGRPEYLLRARVDQVR